MESSADEILLTAGTDGVGELARRYASPLLAYFQRCGVGMATAEDLLQETFLRVVRHRGEFTPGRPFRPWLYTIAANLLRDHFRRRRCRDGVSLDQIRELDPSGEESALAEVLADPSGTPPEQAARAEAVERLRTALGEIPPDLRTTLVLFQYQGLRYREIAEVLGIPIGTVKSRLNAAVARLARAMEAPAR